MRDAQDNMNSLGEGIKYDNLKFLFMNVEKKGDRAIINNDHSQDFQLRKGLPFQSLVGKAFGIFCNDSTPFTFDGITHLGIIRPHTLKAQREDSKPGVAICIGQGPYS